MAIPIYRVLTCIYMHTNCGVQPFPNACTYHNLEYHWCKLKCIMAIVQSTVMLYIMWKCTTIYGFDNDVGHKSSYWKHNWLWISLVNSTKILLLYMYILQIQGYAQFEVVLKLASVRSSIWKQCNNPCPESHLMYIYRGQNDDLWTIIPWIFSTLVHRNHIKITYSDKWLMICNDSEILSSAFWDGFM